MTVPDQRFGNGGHRLRTVTTRPLLLVSLALLLGACTAQEAAPTVDPTLAAGATASATPAPTEDVGEPTAGPSATATPTEGTADGEPTPTPTITTAPTPTAPTPTTAPPAPAVADPAAVALALEEVAVLDAPIAMATRPGDDTLYVAERAGRVVPVAPDGRVGEAIIDIADQTTTGGERGLLGLAWSAEGDRLFLSYTDGDGANTLLGVDVVDGVLRSGTATVLLQVPQPASNHNGGDLHTGPDGNLWWALGDGGAADDRFGNGQRPDTLLGTILRITPTADGYAVPADNPFADGQGGAPEVWAYGLRNPWRIAFDRADGSLWIADVGQNAVEEVNRVDAAEAGLNYGWPRREGDRAFDGQALDGPAVEPVHTYSHARGCSITGGRVYRGTDLDPRMQGAYLYGDYCAGDVHALALDGDQVVADVDTGLDVGNLVSFGEGADGALYVLSLSGPVSKVVPA